MVLLSLFPELFVAENRSFPKIFVIENCSFPEIFIAENRSFPEIFVAQCTIIEKQTCIFFEVIS